MSRPIGSRWMVLRDLSARAKTAPTLVQAASVGVESGRAASTV